MPEPSNRPSDIRSGISARWEKLRRPAYSYVRGSLGTLLGLNRRIPFGVLAVWAVLYGPRPFRLGFYHDDWASLVEATQGTAPFLPGRLKVFLMSDRPVDGVLMFLVNSLGGTSAFTYQLIAAAFVLLAALSLRAWFASLLPEQDFPSRELAADFAAIFWLSIPWSVASTAWPVLAPAAMGTQILFTEASRRILSPRQVTANALTLLGLTLAVSYLLYEPFYLQFFVVAGFYLVYERETFKTRFSWCGLIGVAFGSQLLAIAVNSLSSPRHPAANWFGAFVLSLQGVPRQLENSLGGLGDLWTGIVKVCLLVSLVLVLRGLIDRRLLRPTQRLLGIFLMGTIALPIAVLTYSLGGYSASSSGISARTLQGVSWALTIIFFSLVSILTLPHGRLAKRISLIALLSIVIFDAIAQERLIDDWAFVWGQENELLARVPIEKIRTLPSDSRVLYIGPSYYHGMVIFGAYWDITGAVYSLPPLSRGRRAYQGRATIHSATTLYNWRWDGENLIQECPGYWTKRFPATKLFVWDYERGAVVEAAVGYRLAAKN